jgi:hypothetical protein
MTNDEYFALATDVFTAPENPGDTPVNPDNATAARLAEANRAHLQPRRSGIQENHHRCVRGPVHKCNFR